MRIFVKEAVREGENQEDMYEKRLATRMGLTGVTLKEIGYWRKANQIHHWFVETVQAGNDDCGLYAVSREQLGALLGLVDEVMKSINLVPGRVLMGQLGSDDEGFHTNRSGFVIENPAIAERLLPRRDGFFFGSPDYDSWYFEDLVITKQIIEGALADYPNAEFYYQSDW